MRQLLVFIIGMNLAITAIASIAPPVTPPAHDPCLQSCEVDADCGSWGQCENKVCHYKRQFCVGDRWSINERGEKVDCGAYSCNRDTGFCRRTATQGTDCTPGFVFDDKTSCVISVRCKPEAPGCQELLDKWKQARTAWEDLNPAPQLKPFTCQSCETQENCLSDQMCWNKQCVRKGSYCGAAANGQETSILPPDIVQMCEPYRCDRIKGECLKDCLGQHECGPGYICKENRTCVRTP